jgi:ankyrin repeat protein
MNLLIISDTQENFLFTEKNNKQINALFVNLSSKDFYKQIQNNSNIPLCIIYINDENKLDRENLQKIFSAVGFLQAKSIQVISNIDYLSCNFSNSKIKIIASIDELNKYLKRNQNKFLQADEKLQAQKELLDKGLPVCPSCFAMCIEEDNQADFERFIKAGININSANPKGTPMLNIATRNNRTKMIIKLLDLGADINAISKDRGYTALMDAILRGNEKNVSIFIEHGADVNTINKDGQTNLILAVGENKPHICSLLVNKGANPDIKDSMGMSAYEYAVLFKNQEIIDILQPFHKE